MEIFHSYVNVYPWLVGGIPWPVSPHRSRGDGGTKRADGERWPNAGDVSGCDGSLCLRGGHRYLQTGKQLLGTILELEKYGKHVCKILNLINLPFKPSCFAEFWLSTDLKKTQPDTVLPAVMSLQRLRIITQIDWWISAILLVNILDRGHFSIVTLKS